VAAKTAARSAPKAHLQQLVSSTQNVDIYTLMKPLYSFLLLLLWCCGAVGQNLVPNPSFEDNILCPLISGQLSLAVPWTKIGGGGNMTYYHTCGGTCCDIPQNEFGWQLARSGSGYANVALLYNNETMSFFSEGNFLGLGLLDTLIAGQRYEVEFFLSLMDSARFATKNVGAFFSNEQPPSDGGTLVTFNPQVRYEGDFLTDKEGWMRITGAFVAQGGENFLTIGNFDGYYNSDTLNLNEGGETNSTGAYDLEYWEFAGYYIDDVSVVEDTTWHVGLDEYEMQKQALEVFPNPSDGVFTVNVPNCQDQKAPYLLSVSDVTGKTVFDGRMACGQRTLNLGNLDNGTYLLRVLYADNTERWYYKLVIMH
jgi:hypothetical protein